MDIISYFKNLNNEVLLFLATSLIAFLSWIIKGLVEKPIEQSKTTFNTYFEKRIEILNEIKVRLNIIAYFPEFEESKDYKEEIQKLLLTDGKGAYLEKNIFEAVLKISISTDTNETLLLSTIKSIDEELYKLISKVQDEIRFYRKFSNYSPIKRLVGLSILAINYLLALIIIVSFIGLIIYFTFFGCIIVKCITITFSVLMIILVNKYVND